jgi:acyl phosphate:glycerol-3-phosphate acyltransferase
MPEIYIISFVVSYLFGTIPGAYLIGKFLGNVDVRKEGTGNVGAMNTFEVTGKKSLGVIVLIIDALKGIIAVLITYQFIGWDFYSICISSIAVVVGHNFNIFLKFKGGRGLATAAGLILLLNPYILVSWALMYIAGYYTVKKHVHVGSITGTIFCTFLLYLTPEIVLKSINILIEMSKNQILLLSGGICIVILLRHIKPFRDLLSEK